MFGIELPPWSAILDLANLLLSAAVAILAFSLLACLLLAACSQWRYDLGTPLPATDLPQENMSLAQALDLLGPPQRISATDTGFVLAWEHWHGPLPFERADRVVTVAHLYGAAGGVLSGLLLRPRTQGLY